MAELLYIQPFLNAECIAIQDLKTPAKTCPALKKTRHIYIYIYIYIYMHHKPHKACTSHATSLTSPTRLVKALPQASQAPQGLYKPCHKPHKACTSLACKACTSLTSLACEACHKACEGSYFLFVLYLLIFN